MSSGIRDSGFRNQGSGTALALKNVTRTYTQGGNHLDVLNSVNLEITPGEIVALVGPSGSGKTTLLQVAGLLDTPTRGEVIIGGQKLTGASESARTQARKNFLGFVYQFHHLLPEFSALENLVLPQLIAGKSRKEAEMRGGELLAIMGLSARAHHRPAKLSGGEQQRVAIARAIVCNPVLLLADEPTGNLDPHTAEEVFNFLVTLVREKRLAALIATHNLELAKRMDRIVRLKDGKLVSS